MRRNRIVSKKMSVVAKTTMRFGAIIVFLFVMVILNILSSSSRSQLLKTKRELERTVQKLDDSYSRESSRWEGMMKSERIERALRENCLLMKPPKPCQVVRMSENGLPRAGQLSVAAARKRNGGMSADNAVRVRSPASVGKYARRKVAQ